MLFGCDARFARRCCHRCASTEGWSDGTAEEDGDRRQAAMTKTKNQAKYRGCSPGSRQKLHFSSNHVADGLVCLAVTGFCFGTHRTQSLGIRIPVCRLSPSNGRRRQVSEGRPRRSNAVVVRDTRGAPATPIRAYSSIGQSPRLITGLFLVRVQVGLPLFSGARSRTFT